MGLEIPKLVERLREAFSYEQTRHCWTLEWDVRRSQVTIQEGEAGNKWSQKVCELPPDVQEIIARGGLENWVKGEVSKLFKVHTKVDWFKFSVAACIATYHIAAFALCI